MQFRTQKYLFGSRIWSQNHATFLVLHPRNCQVLFHQRSWSGHAKILLFFQGKSWYFFYDGRFRRGLVLDDFGGEARRKTLRMGQSLRSWFVQSVLFVPGSCLVLWHMADDFWVQTWSFGILVLSQTVLGFEFGDRMRCSADSHKIISWLSPDDINSLHQHLCKLVSGRPHV